MSRGASASGAAFDAGVQVGPPDPTLGVDGLQREHDALQETTGRIRGKVARLEAHLAGARDSLAIAEQEEAESADRLAAAQEKGA